MRAYLRRQADSLDAALVRLRNSLAARRDSTSVRAAFAGARRAYKRVEGVVEGYAPAIAAALNSRRQEVDDDDAPPPSSLAASGFPALESLLWPTVSARTAAAAPPIVDGMRSVVDRIRALSDAAMPTTAQLLEFTRLELARVMTLGIAGFDTPVTGAAMTESADAIDGLRELLASDPPRWRRVSAAYRTTDSSLAATATALRAEPDPARFDRLQFLVAHAIPAAHAVEALRRATGTPPVGMQRFWRVGSASPYDTGAFDPRVFAMSDAPEPSPAVVALGERLFSEPALSGTGTRACSSCHQRAHAFTDGLPRAARIDGHGTVRRHTPTLLNAALSPAYFADERAPSLEEQVVRVLESESEMASSIDRAAAAVRAMPSYRSAFARAFAAPESGAVTPVHLRQAIAAFVRSLVALDSRFDRAARGDAALLSASERRGFDVFMGKAACGTCHFAPLFNGTTPPLYRNADVEVIGTPDADSGRAAIDHLPLHHRAFKTPTLRNVTLTAPYMHHGAYRTLRDVIDFYDRGGGAGAGARIPNQTLPATPLHLTETEKRDLEAFLGALTDTVVAPPATVRR